MMDLARYKTLVFDCDGVILDSNQLKTRAYFDTALAFGANEQHAKALMDYHIRLGGISRYPKYQYFLTEILGQPAREEDIRFLLDRFAMEIHQGLLQCRVADGLHELRARCPQANWMVLSGGDQQELRQLFKARELDDLFDAGIFGSPDNKDQVLARELARGNVRKPGLFLGDSRYDHEAAVAAGLDFVFVSELTEFEGWQDYCAAHDIVVIERLSTLLQD